MKLTDIKGIGPNLCIKLNKLGIDNPLDLVNFIPSEYIDLKKPVPINERNDGDFILIKAKILKITQSTKPKTDVIKIEAIDTLSKKINKIFITYFNQGYYINKFIEGNEYRFLGKIKIDLYGYYLINPSVEDENNIKNLHDGIFTIYPLKGIIGQNIFKKIMKNAIGFLEQLNEIEYTCFTNKLSNKLNQISFIDAIKYTHFPNNKEETTLGLKRLAIEDSGTLIGIYRYLNRKYIQNSRKVFYKTDKNTIVEFKNSLQYKLTLSQEEAIKNIAKDLSSSLNMKRIINGDVGSGKTIVAFFALYCAYKSGHQAVMMAPTGILAKQHFLNFDYYANIFGIKYALLTSETKAEDRKKIISKLYRGEINVLFGTQSILNNDVVFNDLSLIIIDEQHKFGVSERKSLETKTCNADIISISATPIPRTLFLTFYQGISISYIEKRQTNSNTTTHIVYEKKLDDMLNYISSECRKGIQAFIVCPSIEDCEGFELYSAKKMYNSTKDTIFAGLKVALLYGSLNNNEKDTIMSQFKNHQYDIIISTTVIEVGIDTDASILAVLNSERFGLATLHQLRGRIGRRGQKSYCFLHTKNSSTKISDRLLAISSTNNGLELAEKDLEMRGSGDLIGIAQSGHRSTGKYQYPTTIEVIMQATRFVDETHKNMVNSCNPFISKIENYRDFIDIMCDTTLSS